MKKLSKLQTEIVELMRQGWHLGWGQGYSPRAWLQRNGIGRGGPTKEVHLSTFLSLRHNRIVKLKPGESQFGTQEYILSSQ
jgi:hypothetical protein